MLDADQWKRKDIGTGSILRAVIKAIEIPDNNLLQWDSRFGAHRRVHSRFYEALNSRDRIKEFEEVLTDLYVKRLCDGERFEHLAYLCGKRYELIAYLFFIANRHEFLPIRTTWFDRAFAEFDLPLRTARQCSWENYQAYLDVMRSVRRALMNEGIGDASLLDAHSFCWLLATDGRPKEHRAPPRIRSRLHFFSGEILERIEVEPDTSLPSPKVNDRVIDMAFVVEQRTAVGRIAEEIAIKEERQRLEFLRRPDLAKCVKLVSDRPGLGYDIRSVEPDGTARYIEVKHVGQKATFFLSENEWKKCQTLPNYWFYLVTNTDSICPRVELISAGQLEPRHLSPVQYLVRLRRS